MKPVTPQPPVAEKDLAHPATPRGWSSPWRVLRRWWRQAVALKGTVPIRRLRTRHRPRLLQHLLQLDERDRYLRFGYNANDAQIERYVQGLDLVRDDVFAIFNRKLDVVAMAHLAYVDMAEHRNCAEFGVSVLSHVRGMGLGGRLFERAARHARTKGVDLMFIHALSENTAMLRIARSAGAQVHRDGTESEAFLHLPAASADTRVSNHLANHYAELDYHLKKQAQQFWRLLGDVQEIRQGVRDGRGQSAQ